MKKRNIHTMFEDGVWCVKKDDQKKPLSTHRLKVTAMRAAIRHAKKGKCEHVIHNRKGRIIDKDSYGHDPFPPRDKVH